jgi:hypothetical protein
MPVAQRTRKPKPKPKTPESDPRFVKVLGQVKQGASKVKQHPAPAKKAAEAQAAAKAPPNEKMAGAKANQAEVMDKAKPKEPDPNSFEALLLAEIDKLVPQTLDDADKFMEGGESEQVKGNVAGSIKEQKDAAASDIESATAKAPDPGAVPGKQVQALPSDPVAAPPPANGGEAMPTPKSNEEVSQKQTKVDADEALKKEKLTPERLKKANDPRFSAVLTEKAKVDKVADASPAKYRAGEKGVLTQAVAKAQSETRQGMSALANTKNKSNKGVSEQQKAAKERDEKRRAAVTENIDKIFDQTKGAVEKILSNVETEAISAFDRGSTAALATMRRNSDRDIEKFKDERYSGVTGKAQWVADLFGPAPPEIKAIIQANLKAFSTEMRALARSVAQKVDARLKQAKDEIAKGQARISAYVKSLPKDLQAVGKAAEQAVASRFAELEKGVEDRKNALAQKLAERYKAAQDSADALAAQLEKENEGAFAGLVEAIGGIIKILLEFKDKLMSLLRKGADTIELILADPIGFLGNLIGAIKAGISGFLANIWTHLKAGFMKWLFGALGGAGIQIPADLSLPSILKLALDVLGITYERMRAKAVKMIGERNVAILEKLFEYLKELVTGGPAALWAKIKQDLSDLKAMVIDAIQDWLITTIIKAAVTKLLSMFNPAGAIVQAVMAIYNTVMFLIERASQIMEFVEAVINSISAIASGSTGAAAAAVERALANAIPIVIGFLAALIGLGGIGAKIKGIIMKVQAKVDAAIDKAIAKIVAVVKKLFGSGKAKDPKKQEESLKKAMSAARSAVARFSGKKVGKLVLRPLLAAIKVRYGLKTLEAFQKGKYWAVRGTINPGDEFTSGVLAGEEEEDEMLQNADLWELAMAKLGPTTAGDPGAAPTTQISVSSLSQVAAVLDYYIGASPATAARKASISGAVADKITEAGTGDDPHGIYKALQIAAGMVNSLYKVKDQLPAWYKPISLQIHHEQEVHDNRETFATTALERTRLPKPVEAQLQESIKAIVKKYNKLKKKTKAERKQLAEADIEELTKLIKQSLLDWKSTRQVDPKTGKRKAEAQQAAATQTLAEIDLVAAGRNAHAKVHAMRKSKK